MWRESKRELLSPSKEEKSSNSIIRGVGLSARPQHYEDLLRPKDIPWLEILGDNYLHCALEKRKKMQALADHYPLVFHCVGFNLGSTDPLDRDYMRGMRKLVRQFRPAWISDHLCFTGRKNHYSPDLLPILYTKEVLQSITSKIREISDFLETPFLVENVSLYLRPKNSTHTEEEFLEQLSEKSGCGILLDVNNLYVNSENYCFDPYQAFLKLPTKKIKQLHLAGHTHRGTHLVDTHGESIQRPVLLLFKRILKKLGPIPVAIERDHNIPSFQEIWGEMETVKEIYGQSTLRQ